MFRLRNGSASAATASSGSDAESSENENILLNIDETAAVDAGDADTPAGESARTGKR